MANKRKSNAAVPTSKPSASPRGSLSPQDIRQIAAQVAPMVAQALRRPQQQPQRSAAPPQRQSRAGLPPNVAALLEAAQNTGRRNGGDPRQRLIDQLAMAQREAALKGNRNV